MAMKPPYLMTEAEWTQAREACHPENIQSNPTKRAGSEAIRKFQEMQRLCYGVRDADKERYKLASEGKVVLFESELEDLLWRLHTCVTWEEVREKARREGKI